MSYLGRPHASEYTCKLVVTLDQITLNVRPSRARPGRVEIWDDNGLCLMEVDEDKLETRKTAKELAEFYSMDELVDTGGEVVEHG